MKSLWEIVSEPDNDHHYGCWKDGLEKQDWECFKWRGWKEQFEEYEKLVREQIAQEIEDKCDLDNIENCLLVNHDLCNFHVSANIARGK